ncbi:MAG: hypothetical protein V3T31_10805, partial [candidate division Zixibacteria bacterium]
RLNDLTSLILSEVDEDDEDTILGSYYARKSRGELKSQRDEQGDGIAIPPEYNPYDAPAYVDANGNVHNAARTDIVGVLTNVRDYASEAHWISEELEHRIRKTEYAGLCDILISPDGVFLPSAE